MNKKINNKNYEYNPQTRYLVRYSVSVKCFCYTIHNEDSRVQTFRWILRSKLSQGAKHWVSRRCTKVIMMPRNLYASH